MIRGIVLNGKNEDFKFFELYNFSGIKGQTKVSRRGLHFYSSKVTVVFSCVNKDFVDYFLTQLFKYPEINIGNLELVPEYVEKEETMELSTEHKFISISPIVLKTPSFNDADGKKFIPPESDEFSDLLYESTMNRMEKIGIYNAEQLASFYKFQVVPDKGYIRKLTEAQKKFARIYPVYDQDVKYEVRGYTVPFTLYAAKEVQEFLFNTGIGSFTHKGFGMLDLAHSDPNKRAVKYEFNYVS